MLIERTNTISPEQISIFIVESFSEGHHFLKQFLHDLDEYDGYHCTIGEGIFIAKIQNKVVGILGLYQEKYYTSPKLAYLKHIYVLPQFRKQGIATALLQQAIVHASSHMDFISVQSPNIVFNQLFNRLGFTQTYESSQSTFVYNIVKLTFNPRLY